MRSAQAALAALLLACTPIHKGGPRERAAPAAPDAGVAAAVIGSACEAVEPFSQGSCAVGQLCLPGPGGYCGALCGAGCPTGAACVEGPRVPELCLAACSADTDCRAGEGYVCDADWKVCAPPGMLHPPPPACAEGSAPPRTLFGAVHQVTTAATPGRSQLEPGAALLASGDLVTVAFATGNGKENPLVVATVGADGKVTGDRVLATERGSHFDPWMAADASGRLHLVWLGFDGGRAPEKRMQIGYSWSDDGVTWAPPIAVHDAASDCPEEMEGCMDKPMIAIGPDPRNKKQQILHVLYYSAATEGLRAVRSTDGGNSWSTSNAVGSGAYGDVEVSADGQVHVVYVAGGPQGTTGVEYVNSTDGGQNWSTPVRVSNDDQPVPFYFSNPQVAYDVKKKALYVAFPSGGPDGKWDILLATSTDGGKKWAYLKVNDDAPCANHMTPSIALDTKTGKTYVAWLENRAGAGRVALAVCDPGGKTCGPNQSVSDAPFASYSFARHSPRWLGEYFALVVDARRRTLHAVWTQTVDEGGKAIGRIFHAAAKLP